MRVDVTINNWEKFNPRKDLKATSWLRLQNSLFEDPQFFDFTHTEICFWIYILSQASKKQTGQITIHFAHAERIGRFSRENVESAIKKLSDIDCVTAIHVDVTPTSHARHADVPLRTNAPTRNERNETIRDEHVQHTHVTRRKPTADSATAEVGKQSNELIARYCELWKERYKTQINFSGRWAGNAKTLVKDHGPKKALELVEAFMKMNDKYFIDNRHAFELILNKLAAITHYAGTGIQITQTQLNQFDKTLANKNAGEEAAKYFLKGEK